MDKNIVACGDSEILLNLLDEESIGLIFTSPPYYNARPQYAEYVSYQEYLNKMSRVLRGCFRVLAEGRFIVINVSPVLIPRAKRSESSHRIAIPFDFHRILTEEGFDFVDDIIWEKPTGAGWSYGRGRRFAADRNPLQYKPVPVTEYVLVYRKHTEKLIDWNIRSVSPDRVEASKIPDDYEVTNIWKFSPSHSKIHPATFPVALASKVIQYYSFVGDFVLDPFAGTGTVGKAAVELNRKFVLLEKEFKYFSCFKKDFIENHVIFEDWTG